MTGWPDNLMGRSMPKSDLPFGSEFSPSQVDLRRCLEIAEENDGDWPAYEDAVRAEYFEKGEADDHNRAKLANNNKLGMQAYGLMEKTGAITDVGRRLYDIREDPEHLYAEFARHILLNLHGMTLVQCIQDMHAAGEPVDLVKLREWLDERGVHFPRGGKHASIMRLWLEKAGVFTNQWQINTAKLQNLIGLTVAEFEALAQLSGEQRAYVKALVNIGDPGPYQSNAIERLARATYGVKFNEKTLPKDVLYPLQAAGLIDLERGTKEGGHGAKPFFVRPTAKLQTEVITPLLDQLDKQVASDLRPFLRKPFAEILVELDSPDRYIAGLALEALTIKLMRLVDLQYVATRLRGTATGGAEVDVIFESSRLVFSRWQVQCKNTSRVSLDDVAKEVGLTHFLKSNVIVMISTGTIGAEACRYANKIMKDSNLCLVMVDRADIDTIRTNPTAIIDTLNREAQHAMDLKKLDLEG